MFRLLASSATALILATSPVMAELAPAQVWEDIVQYYEKFGYQVTAASRDEAGDRLTLKDVTFSMSDDVAAGTKLELLAPRITLSQTGGGDVRTVFEGDMTGNITLPEAPDSPQNMTMTLSMPGNEMISSGDDSDMIHALNYPAMTMMMNITGPDDMVMPIKVEATNTTGSYHMVKGAPMRTTYDMTMEKMRMSMGMAFPEGSDQGAGEFNVDATLAGLTMTGEAQLPDGEYDFAARMTDALRAGVDFSGKFTYGEMAGEFDFAGVNEEGEANTGQGTFSGEGGDLSIAMNKDGIQYTGSSKPASMQITSPEMPFPISYTVQSGSFDILLPMLKSDTAQPFKFAYALGGLSLGDEIWALFDPTAQLPRDPADLMIDVSGDLMVTSDLIDPELQAKIAAAATPTEGNETLTPEQQDELEALMDEAQPYEPKSIKINRVALKAVGVDADMSGDLTIPEGGDMAQPVGTLDGTFRGVNGLIDKLVAMGLVPQDQVMGARMMMMMFARPVEGEADTMTTQLEFQEGGSIFANGQQVR